MFIVTSTHTVPPDDTPDITTRHI